VIRDSVRIALRAILANRLRSALTMLGLIIGVSSVIILLAVGRGAQGAIAGELEGLGTNVLTVLRRPPSRLSIPADRVGEGGRPLRELARITEQLQDGVAIGIDLYALRLGSGSHRTNVLRPRRDLRRLLQRLLTTIPTRWWPAACS